MVSTKDVPQGDQAALAPATTPRAMTSKSTI
jgi:hypothetical protein